MSFYNFQTSKNKRISLLGMSGVGKTHLANLLRQAGNWFHYSGDYRIGSQYLDKPILDNIKKVMMTDDFLHPLLANDAIRINNNITFDNLLSVSSFLGRLGNPEQGALPLDEFITRQNLHAQAETKAMADVPDFIGKSQDVYHCEHFINDAGGSLCELAESVIKNLSKHTLLIYLKTSPEHEKTLIDRAVSCPKPLYYQPDFLVKHLELYLQNHGFSFVAQIDPDDFSSWLFPKLFYHRLPKYEYLAQKYGITISSDDLYQCKSTDDFFALMNAGKINL